MSAFVVDASVAVKWFFEEEHSEQAICLLDGTHKLYMPDYLYLEMDSVLCKRIRRGHMTTEQAHAIRTALRQFPLQIHSWSALQEPAFDIAAITAQSVYDCLYVALAMLTGATLVTADRRLYDGLSVEPFARSLLWIADLR